MLFVTITVVAAGAVTGSLGDVTPEEPAAEPIPEDVSTAEGCEFLQDWYSEMLDKHPTGTAVPLEYHPSDEDLAQLGLPPADELADMAFDEPTMFRDDGTTVTVSEDVLAPRDPPASEEMHHKDGHDKGGSDDGGDNSTPSGPGLATYAGTGCLGIRPGGWILVITDNAISWCTLAHVYGDQISTAGHCAGTGQEITMIGLVGDNDLAPVLLDFGEVATSHDNGIGDDYALIDVYDRHEDLMTPTMCAWGGPFLGTYGNEGVLVQGGWGGQGPSFDVNPDPTLVQGIVHYGHGTGIGTGGTPRAGAGASWGSNYFTFVGAIGPGDSGSGANTATTEAAGIITHLIVDPVMRQGVGIAAGTRATVVGSPSMGLPVGTPVPLASAS